jgi:hypothetical protein
LNDLVGRFFDQRMNERLVAISGDVLLDFFRIDLARILQYHIRLPLEERLLSRTHQLSCGFALRTRHQFRCIFGCRVPVQHSAWFVSHQRPQ